jgi:peptidyl-prolyl cis-trans isomerase D
VGVNVAGEGYEVVQVDKVLARDPKEADPVAAKAQYAQIFGAAEVQAYYAALKTRQKAEITEAANQPAAEQTPR